MSLVENLLDYAAEIRDANQEGENTALRVGSFLISLLQALVSATPGRLIDAAEINTHTTGSDLSIIFRTKDSDGVQGSISVIIHAATANKAGLMTPTDKQSISQNTSDIANNTRALTDHATRLQTAEQAIALNTSGIANNALALSDHATRLQTAEQAIALNTSGIANNAQALTDHATRLRAAEQEIALNTSGIANNAQTLSDHATQLQTVEQAIALNTPIEIGSEEEMEDLIAADGVVEGQIYFVSEEED